MVDIVSAAPGMPTIRRVSPSFRLRSSTSGGRDKVLSAAASVIQHIDAEPMVRVCLEVHEDRSNGEVIYRLINIESGEVIQEWRGSQIHELREFLRQNE